MGSQENDMRTADIANDEFNATEVTIVLDACNPESLFTSETPWPEDLKFKLEIEIDKNTYWAQATLTGPRVVVRQFVELHWGEDCLEDLVEEGCI